MKTKPNRMMLAVLTLALSASLFAHEDPPGCSFPNGRGNESTAGVSFHFGQAHVGDVFPMYPYLGMLSGACRATEVTGSIWTAASSVASWTNFLVNATLDPGDLPVFCPGDAKCQPGPYLLTITAAMVGAPVHHPFGTTPGLPGVVRAVGLGQGTVHTTTAEELGGFNTRSVAIVTPCIQVIALCAYPPNSPTCFPAGGNIDLTGYVTNCGDIRLTNVMVAASRTLIGGGLTDLNGFPLIQPLAMEPGQALAFRSSFAPTPAETCAGGVFNTLVARGTDTTTIGGPQASVTNSVTTGCAICVTPCLRVTMACDTVPIGAQNTMFGVITNCGNITVTNIVLSSLQTGLLTTIPSLAPRASLAYSGKVFNPVCGAFANIVSASGATVCGAPILARATNVCMVTEFPCLQVTRNCSPAALGAPTTVSGVVINCGDVVMTNVVVSDSAFGSITNISSLAPGASRGYAKTALATQCGTSTNSVTVTGRSACGTSITARATNTCVVTCAPTLTNPKLAGGQLTFAFATVPGRTNTVQSTATLLPANWLPLTNFLGDGSSVTISDPAAGQGRFYRVLVQ